MADARDNFIPWGLRPLQDFVFDELKKRSKSYGIDYTSLDNYDGQEYNGPRTSWVRVCSNGKIPTDPAKRRNPPRPNEGDAIDVREGFIMYGVNGFNDTYGIDDLNNQSKVVLGYDVNDKKHVLDDSENQTFQNRPGPGVTSIESEFYGAGSSFNGLCRKVSIKWRANSIDQLNYMMPYFLSPMMTVVVEWGWNVYNPDSLIDLTDIGEPANPETNKKGSGLRGYYTNSQLLQERIEKSNGNYDAFIGRIYDFNFALTRDGGYECTTVVVNANYMLGGLSTFDKSKTNEDNKKEEAEILNFRKFVIDDKNIDNMFEGNSFKEGTRNYNRRGRVARRRQESPPSSSSTGELQNIAKKAIEEKKLFYKESDRVKGLQNNVDKQKYIKFDVFIELLNYFYSKKIDGQIPFTFIDIENTKVCAYPTIKSTDRDVLIPNKYAPKFWKVSKNVAANKTAGVSQTEIESKVLNTEYGKLLYKIGESVKQQINTADAELYYDDLDDLINSGEPGREFPQLKNDFGPMGYWGYLKDIYISTELIKTELERNDKYQEFLKAILERINRAAVNIFKLRIIPNDPSENTKITIIDDNYFPIGDEKLKKVTETPIVIGSVNSSYIINASLDVKLSAQVAAQTLFGNAVYDYRSKKNNNAKTEHDGPSALFVYTDRLFSSIAQSEVSETVEDESVGESNTDSNIKEFLYVKIKQSVTEEDIKAAKEKFDEIKTQLKAAENDSKFYSREIKRLRDSLNSRRGRFTSAETDVINRRITANLNAKAKADNRISNLKKAIIPAEAEYAFLQSNARVKEGRTVSVILVENKFSVQQLFKDAEILDDDGNIVKNNMYIYNTIMPDTELSLEFLGIAGLRYLDTFTIDGVAEPYTHKKAIWQVDKVNSVVSGNSWKTVVVAKVRPHSFFAKNNNSVVASRPEPAPQNSSGRLDRPEPLTMFSPDDI
jgi:hypothetical protein